MEDISEHLFGPVEEIGLLHVPFLRPSLPRAETLTGYLNEIDASHIYSNFGPLVSRFERRLIDEWFGHVGHAITVSNATIGLMLAISNVTRRTGGYALMPSFTFSAAPLAALWCGLTPYFIDIEPGSWHMDQARLMRAVQELGEDVAVIVPYAAFGDDPGLDFYAGLHIQGLPVVIDAASSFGTQGDHLTFGTASPCPVVFSFHATKPFGIGEGGLIYSSDAQMAAQIRSASNFGFDDQRECTLLGMNAKISEYTAAIALAGLDMFPRTADILFENCRKLKSKISEANLLNCGWQLQQTRSRTPRHFLSLLCPPGALNRDVALHLEKHHIQARTYFSPACHQQSFFQKSPHSGLEVTEDIASRIISLPMWNGIGEDALDRTVEALTTFL
ncbi:DegT/DnrJ/EryC1/StrS family aminotransferase [Deinococcus sp.]|uniref:DegT/DnrJ/EryC1/StrS family aminotransferase n=1 Tax=Deinococcus sp. TaxID=47478 RepID=UPI003C7C5A1A